MENKILCTLTYAPQKVQLSTIEAKRRLTTFIQRLRRYVKKHGYAPLHYKCVDDKQCFASLYHHIVINFASNEIVAKIWNNGYTRLQSITSEQYQRILRR